MTSISSNKLSSLVMKKFKGDQDLIGDWYKKYTSVRIKNKLIILKKQDHKCDVCSKLLTLKNSTIEHIVPLSHKGLDCWKSNWTVTCHTCNNVRGSKYEYSYFKENHKTIIKDHFKKKQDNDLRIMSKRKHNFVLDEITIKICYAVASFFDKDFLKETCLNFDKRINQK